MKKKKFNRKPWKRELSYPPKSEWGSTKDFEPSMFYKSKDERKGQTLRRRCQEFDLRKVKEGSRGAAAQCIGPAVSGSEFCFTHTKMRLKSSRGGHAARGVKKIDNPSLKREMYRYRDSIPPNLLVKFLDAMSDPNKLSLESELAIITARVDELLQRVDQRQSRYAWSQVIAARDILSGGVRSQDPQEFTRSVTTALSMISKAVTDSDYKVWDELFNAIQHRKSLAESERRRQVEERQAVTAEEMIILMGQVQAIILSLVRDDGLRLEIAQRLMMLVDSNPALLSEPKDGRMNGCQVCSLQDFRERNRINGVFTCPMCGAVDTTAKVIEGSVSKKKEKRYRYEEDPNWPPKV